MKVGVKVLPRPEVLDSQGRAVVQTLTEHGRKIDHCRVGKYIELDIEGSDKNAVLKQAKELAEFVLYNPLIETFELEVVGE